MAGPAPQAPRPPSVDALARTLAPTGLPHPVRVDVARAAIARGDPASAVADADRVVRAQLQPVVNATGVLLHTNLGRAPLAVEGAAAYSNLELDLDSGRRGSRQAHAGPLLARACGAEAALVVNNGAAAVLLVLAALAEGRGVAVSRGELVEIGGGFRIPEVLERSGARLVEVGTTNRTRRADYEAVVAGGGSGAPDVAVVLKVHASNYRIEGFTAAAGVDEVATLGPPVVVDLGSGLVDAACPWLPDGPPAWLAAEPAARQTLASGAAVVTFSGDKLLGGPQAGIIAGRRDLVDGCAAHPLYRALRPGSMVLNAVAAVATSYLDRTAGTLPFWRMATEPVQALRSRADAIVAAVGALAAVGAPSGPAVRSGQCTSVTGGGTLPGVEIPSWGVHLDGDHAAALRHARPLPVIATVRDGGTHLDLRTVDTTGGAGPAGATSAAADQAVVAALAGLASP